MSWPTGGNYSDAIQNPSHCFHNPQLQNGTVKTNPLGLPSSADGNFAIVFQLNCGSDSFAIKCFKSSVADRAGRYHELSQYLGRVTLPALTQFQYMPDAMEVNGQRYPIVKMEWADAKPLDQYIASALKQGQSVGSLAGEVKVLCEDMAREHIAHGDFQHGNILVNSQGKVRLVDYDGMFVPPLSAMPPNESGHQNYQHPQRYQHGYHHENADAFSALVIYLSLRALEYEPQLWADFYTDNNLIFTAEDFNKPGATGIWWRLKSSSDSQVRDLTGQLESFCGCPVASVPSLSAVLAGLSSPTSAPAASQGAGSAATGSGQSNSWYMQAAANANQPVTTSHIPYSPPAPSYPPANANTPIPSAPLLPHAVVIDSENRQLLLKIAVGLVVTIVIALLILSQLNNLIGNTRPSTTTSVTQPQQKR